MKNKSDKSKAVSAPVAPAVPIAPVAPVVAPVTLRPYTTQHVAPLFGLRPVELRRVLRSMEPYADGVHTAYRFASLDIVNDPELAAIAQAVNVRSGQRQAAQAAAVARLAATKAAADAQAAAAKAAADAAAKTAQPIAPKRK